MAKKKVTFCENHPDIATSDSCEVCGKNICYNCLKVFTGRTFCSRKCIRKYALDHIRQFFIDFSIKTGWIITWPIHGLLRVQKWRGLEWCLVLGLALSIYLNIQLKKELDVLQSVVATGAEGAISIDDKTLPPAHVFKPAEGGMVQSNRIDISGEAEENWIVSLSRDDKVISVKLPENGKFEFTNVRLYRGQNELVVRALNQEGRVVVLQTLNLQYGLPTLRYLLSEIKRGPVGRKRVAFTFDGGAEDNAADEILDYLKEENVRSTFFLTGRFIQQYPQTVRRIVSEGHEVGNHTMNHPHLTTYEKNRRHYTRENITRDLLHNELNKTAQRFECVTKKKMSYLWRAPYGERNNDILKWAAEAGYKHIGWTVGRGWEENMDTMDWVADKNSKAYHSAEEIADKILSYADNTGDGADGVIILMHLGTNRKDDYPHKKLPEILKGLKQRGYEPVTVSELLGMN
ncbi:polysaccharide deacetylase family protein [bacterium]|nr:polysaccharide deacetylase family protein [bacterium]